MISAWQPHEVREPTPEEIEAACAGIPAGWSQSVRRRRAGRKNDPVVLAAMVTTVFGLDRRRASSPNYLEYL